MKIVRASALTPTGSDGNAAGPVATPSTGATDVSVIRQRQGAGGIGREHRHDREEVLLPVSGQIAISAAPDRLELGAGDAVIIPAGLVHRVETVGDAPAEWLLIATAGVRFFGADGLVVSPGWAE